MKKIFLFNLLILITTFSFSQRNTVASGGNASGTGGTLNYTVGQTDYINTTSSSGNINQGVQQPFEFYENDASINEYSFIDLSLYPNPSNEYIVLNLNSTLENLSYQLLDMSGRLITTSKISSTQTIIDMRNHSVGTYHLSILEKNETVKSIKIIKN